MKKSLLLGLGTIALALGGAAFGLHAANAVETKATGVSGTITLDLTNSRTDGDYWYSSACNVAINFHDSSWTKQEWSSYVSLAANQMEIEIPYDVTFTPDQFSIVRYAGSFTESAWESDRWGSAADAKWGEVANLTYADNAHGYFTNYTTVSVGTYALIHSSEGAGAGVWGDKMNLTGIKLNGSKHCEYYSNAVSLKADEEFGIKLNGVWYTTVSKSDYVSAKFSGGNGVNIKCVTAGTYAFYFDSSSKSLYITDPLYAAADEWAQTFLAGGCTKTKDNWTALSGTYAALDADVKAIFVGVAADGDEDGAYYEHAVARYDLVLRRYGVYDSVKNPTGYADFMGRAAKLSLAKTAVSAMSTNNNSGAVWAVVIGSVSVAALLGAGFFFRKRRQN